ncbi:hypothetical protein L1766_07780 [Thermovorax subterraneus]|nr:hypothetical protein [Thermovorax subterraneus]
MTAYSAPELYAVTVKVSLRGRFTVPSKRTSTLLWAETSAGIGKQASKIMHITIAES